MLNREFKFYPSRRHILFIIVLVISTLAMLGFMEANVWLKIILAIFVLLHGASVLWRRGLLKSQHSILGIQYAGDQNYFLLTSSAKIPVKLLGDSTVTGWVSFLRFKGEKRFWPYSCMIFPDALPPDQYRQLMVMLFEECK